MTLSIPSTHTTMADMEVDSAPSKGKEDGKKRFEVKKVHPRDRDRDRFAHACHQWNAVSLWAWDIVVDNCAICRNHIMDLCTFLLYLLSLADSSVGIDCQANQVSATSEECNAAWGICNVCQKHYSMQISDQPHVYSMHSISTVSPGGSKRGTYVLWITVNGNYKSASSTLTSLLITKCLFVAFPCAYVLTDTAVEQSITADLFFIFLLVYSTSRSIDSRTKQPLLNP